MDLEKVDFLTEIDSLRSGWQACQARLAAVEAERDAARAKRDAARAEVAHMKREQQAMIMQHRHDIRDLGELLQDERCKVATLEAQRDRALAGEARAVEALWKYRSAQRRMLDKWADGDNAVKTELWRGLHDCEKLADAVLCQAQPALDWLAQQRRAAAAEALEGIGAKQTSASGPAAQKVETLIFLADTADKLARLDCELIDRAAMAQRAALFRECAAMMRERAKNDPQWTLIDGDYRLKYRGYDLVAFESPRRRGFFTSGVTKKGQGLILFRKMSLPAAQAAAVAWVDEQEGKDV